MNSLPKILITGVAGLVGSNFAQYLLDKGYIVYGLDDLSGGYQEFIPKKVKFTKISITDTRRVGMLFKRVQPNVVYHFAAYAAEGLSPFIRKFNYTNNLIGSINIINNCIKYNSKLVFTSSMAVYGQGSPPFTEDMLLNPVDPYGISKYAVEMDLKQAGEQFGLQYTIVRPHNIIGLNQNIWDKYRNVIGIWIRQVIEGKPITIFGDGEQLRAFSDIKFYMEPLERLADLNGDVFNLGADKKYRIMDAALMVKKVARSFGYEATIEHLPPRHEVKYAYCDHAKAKALLGFKDETDLEQTISDMFKWAIHQPPHEVKQMEYEIDKNIYDYWK